MDCRRCRPLLEAYLEGELREEERLEFEKHIGGCADCRKELDEARKVMELVSSLDPLKAPRDFLQGVRAKIDGEQSVWERFRLLWARPLRLRHSFGVLAIIVVSLTLFVWVSVRGLIKEESETASMREDRPPDRVAMDKSKNYEESKMKRGEYKHQTDDHDGTVEKGKGAYYYAPDTKKELGPLFGAMDSESLDETTLLKNGQEPGSGAGGRLRTGTISDDTAAAYDKSEGKVGSTEESNGFAGLVAAGEDNEKQQSSTAGKTTLRDIHDDSEADGEGRNTVTAEVRGTEKLSGAVAGGDMGEKKPEDVVNATEPAFGKGGSEEADLSGGKESLKKLEGAAIADMGISPEEGEKTGPVSVNEDAEGPDVALGGASLKDAGKLSSSGSETGWSETKARRVNVLMENHDKDIAAIKKAVAKYKGTFLGEKEEKKDDVVTRYVVVKVAKDNVDELQTALTEINRSKVQEHGTTTRAFAVVPRAANHFGGHPDSPARGIARRISYPGCVLSRCRIRTSFGETSLHMNGEQCFPASCSNLKGQSSPNNGARWPERIG